jgi:hypothetical protein
MPRVVDREALPASPLWFLALAAPAGALPYFPPLTYREVAALWCFRMTGNVFDTKWRCRDFPAIDKDDMIGFVAFDRATGYPFAVMLKPLSGLRVWPV